MDEIKKIFEDEREIKGIYSDEGREGWTVGKTVTKIIPYQENGEMAPITWLAVYKNENIIVRIAARGVQIHYL